MPAFPAAARPFTTLTICWALVADTVPLYALYALWFTDSGLTDAEIASLFILWSATGFLAEVPTGALADGFSRRANLVAAGLIQAAGFVLWTVSPGFGMFAAGFVLWGLSGSLVSGAFEALLYDGLAEVGAHHDYQRVLGWITAITMVAEIPAALAGSLLFWIGGYPLVGWVSVAVSVAAAALATRFREPPRHPGHDDDDEDLGTELATAELSYLATLRLGLSDAARSAVVRRMLIAVALVTGLDGLDEYFPLMAQDWQVPTVAVPIAILGIPFAGAIGAAYGGRGATLTAGRLAMLLGFGAALLGTAAILRLPVGLVAVSLYYGLHQFVLVAVDAQLQHRIAGRTRATVTSLASLGTEVAAIGLYLGWALGGLPVIVVAAVLISMLLPRLLRR